jgi:cell wall-associated NlpC family hydrolase
LSRRTRFLLPLLVFLACLVAQAPLAGATIDRGDRIHRHKVVRRGHRHKVVHHFRVSRILRERASVVRYARRFLGVPYVWGGVSPSGFDCSGFTRYVYAHFGVSLPHYTYSQFDLGRVVRGALKPGDLVFFDGVGHVGLYIGDNRFIHAPHTGTHVTVDSLSGWYAAAYDGARRLLS